MIIIIAAICLISCGTKKIKAPRSADDYKGMNYEEAVMELQEAGFTSIESNAVEDITSDGEIPDGAVESILIGEASDFTAEDKFVPETKVSIVYHAVPKLIPPYGSAEAAGQIYSYVEKAFKDAGFINVSAEQVYDLDPDTLEGDYKTEVLINGNNTFANTDSIPFDADIKVIGHYPYNKYNVKVIVNFIGNLIFSKYDVDLFADDVKEYTLKHGTDAEIAFRLREGQHVLSFVNSEDSTVKGETELNVMSDVDAAYTIYCYSDKVKVDTDYIDNKIELAEDEVKVSIDKYTYIGENYEKVEKDLRDIGFTNIKTVAAYDIVFGITEPGSTESLTIDGKDDYNIGDIFKKDVEVVITYSMKEEDDPSYKEDEEVEEKEETSETKEESQEKNESDSPAKKSASTGIHAYKSRGGEYVNYYIIDFDEGYVYSFSEGNGNDTCDKLKIQSGDLNSGVVITYHDGGDEWSYILHYQYVDQPAHLILVDNDGFGWDFYETLLDNAMSIKNKKNIREY